MFLKKEILLDFYLNAIIWRSGHKAVGGQNDVDLYFSSVFIQSTGRNGYKQHFLESSW